MSSLWNFPSDLDVNNDMMTDWFQNTVVPIDVSKIFDLPADDIGSSVPWCATRQVDN